MAETFEATRLGAGGFEQRVCLKRVLPAFGQDLELVSRFRREARLAARLRHTNIVGVIDVGEIEGAYYMALELVDGVDLRSLLKTSPQQKLLPETVALIALDLAFALEHAHGALVHRDISPSNILLSRSGDAKLADFGIAKALDGAKVTASRTARGKVPYMAPEYIKGEAIDGRADLFSLGVVMFEAIAGSRPFDGAHDVETMQRILSGRRAPLPPDAPPALVRIIEGLLTIDRDARIQTASDLLDALAEVAPSPRARRALASSVEGHRGGPGARLHVRAREEERDTELTRLPSAAVPPTTKPSPKPRRGRPLLIGAALLAAGLVVTALATREPKGTQTAAGTPSVPATASVSNLGSTESEAGTETGAGAETGTETETGTEIGTRIGTGTGTGIGIGTGTGIEIGTETGIATETESDPVHREPSRHIRRGWVRIVVQPWGNVWIDGTYMGRAPLTARLSKGRHIVEVGRELPALKRAVRVQPGARKEMAFNLAE